MLNIKYKSLSDGFSALFYALNGEKVLLEIPENMTFLKENLIIPLFVENNFSSQKNSTMFGFAALEKAAKTLNILSPNTFYKENIYAFTQESNPLKNLTDKFLKKVIVADENFNGIIVKTAPGYRCNYSRLVISVIKTLRDLGSDYVLVSENAGNNVEPYLKYSFYKTTQPEENKYKTIYFPKSGIYLFSRCGEHYAISENAENFTETGVKPLEKTAEVNFREEDLPLQAFLTAKKYVKPAKELETLRLNGSGFEFSPSMPDVIGYADAQFDLIKRDGVNINDFKNAVFDFGTHIEEIIDLAYSLHKEFPKAQKAFEEAVKSYKKNELK